MKGKGFRQIDNEYFLALLAAGLEGNAYQVLLTVIHFTLGYDQRDTAEISHRTFQELTKLSRNSVRRAISSLISQGLISKVSPETNRQAATYRVNKDWRGKVDLSSGGVAGEPSTLSSGGVAGEPSTLSAEGSQVNPPSVAGEPSRGSTLTPTTTHIKKERKLIKKDILSIFDHWNSQNIIKHEKMTAAIQSAIQAALKEYSKEAICLAIKNYGIILHGDFKWSHKWTLAEFLSRGKGNNMERFKDLSVLKENYQRDNRPARNVTYEDVSS